MAEFVHCEPQDLAFIPNATTGLNTVLSNIGLPQGSEVLMLDIGYGSVKTMARAACEQQGATLLQAKVPVPLDLRSSYVTHPYLSAPS
jgi:isopenicillin-N epimerase